MFFSIRQNLSLCIQDIQQAFRPAFTGAQDIICAYDESKAMLSIYAKLVDQSIIDLKCYYFEQCHDSYQDFLRNVVTDATFLSLEQAHDLKSCVPEPLDMPEGFESWSVCLSQNMFRGHLVLNEFWNAETFVFDWSLFHKSIDLIIRDQDILCCHKEKQKLDELPMQGQFILSSASHCLMRMQQVQQNISYQDPSHFSSYVQLLF